MRRWFIPLLVLLSFIAASCKKQESLTATPLTINATIAGLVTVADPSATKGETAPKTLIFVAHPGHTAVIAVQERNVDTKQAGLTRLGVRFHETEPWWGYVLNGVQVELLNDTSDAPAPLSFSNWAVNTNTERPANDKDAQQTESLHWVPSISRILAADFPRIEKYFMVDPKAGDVHARMPLRGGKLFSLLTPPKYIWGFRRPEGFSPLRQILAGELHYTFPLKDGATTYTIYGRPFDKPKDPPKPLFQVKQHGVDPEIPLLFLNIPLDEFTQPTPNIDVGHRDPHFHLHFNMLEGAPAYDAVIQGKVVDSQPLTKIIYCGPVAVQ